MEIIDNLDKKTIFWYVVIFIIIMFVFSNFTIGLNIIFGFIIASIIITYLYYNRTSNQKQVEELDTEKQKIIFPNYKSNKKDVGDFLFSIQDFYSYNPIAYEDMVQYIDYFFALYDESMNDNSKAGINYQTLINQKRNVMNSLESIMLSIPPNIEYDAKLEKSIHVVNIILNRYIENVKKINDTYLYENGFTTTSKIIVTNDVPAYNTYDDKIFSYTIW